MAKIEVRLPAMGEGIIEATLTKILVPQGQHVDEDQPIVEVATDKVDTEVPSPEAGVVAHIHFHEGDVVPVGSVLVTLSSGEQADEDEAELDTVAEAAALAPEVAPFVAQIEHDIHATSQAQNEAPDTDETSSGRYLSPLVRNIAHSEGIPLAELEQLQGTGLDGRLVKADILAYIETRQANPAPEAREMPTKAPQMQSATPAKTQATKSIPVPPGSEIVEMDRMRRLISDHMIASKQTSAHVTSFVEVDMTPVVDWRNKHKDAFMQRYGQKLTFMPIFVEAVARALRDFPMVNVSVDGYKIIKKPHVHIGMATALPSGNLIVPVIRQADTLNLAGLAGQINDLASRARNNKLKPDEIGGGTFSITNMGTFGNITGTPIINQPEVAILAVGVIQKKPAVIETPQGDTLGIRHQMIMALSYDHRVVDGALGGMFLRRVGDYLEQFDTTRGI